MRWAIVGVLVSGVALAENFLLDFADGTFPPQLRRPFANDCFWWTESADRTNPPFFLEARGSSVDERCRLIMALNGTRATVRFDTLRLANAELHVDVNGQQVLTVTEANLNDRHEFAIRAGIQVIRFRVERPDPQTNYVVWIDNIQYTQEPVDTALTLIPPELRTSLIGPLGENLLEAEDVVGDSAKEILVGANFGNRAYWFVAQAQLDGSLNPIWTSASVGSSRSSLDGPLISLVAFEEGNEKRIATLAADNVIRIYATHPLRLIRIIGLDWPAIDMDIGDIDADGELEIVLVYDDIPRLFENQLWALSYGTGGLKNRILTVDPQSTTLAQLDADPQLELITPKLTNAIVRDGLTQDIEWISPWELSNPVLAGNIGRAPFGEFVGYDPELRVLRVYDSVPAYWERGETIASDGPPQFGLVDVEGDGRLELVAGPDRGPVIVYGDPVPTLVTNVDQAFSGRGRIVGGQLSNPGISLVTWSSSPIVASAQTGQLIWREARMNPTPFALPESIVGVTVGGTRVLVGPYGSGGLELSAATLESLPDTGRRLDGDIVGTLERPGAPSSELLMDYAGEIRTLDVKTREVSWSQPLSGDTVLAAPFDDDRIAALGFYNGYELLLINRTNKQVSNYDVPWNPFGPVPAAFGFGADGFATDLSLVEDEDTEDARLWFVDLASGDVTNTVIGLPETIRVLNVPAHNEIWVSRNDGRVDILRTSDLSTIKTIRFLAPVSELLHWEFLDNRYLLAVSDGHFLVKDLNQDKTLIDLPGLSSDFGSLLLDNRGQSAVIHAASAQGIHKLTLKFNEPPLFADSFE
ncbi:MAG: hypothetical protein AAGA23_15640 [Pseudomonadota bacterium]